MTRLLASASVALLVIASVSGCSLLPFELDSADPATGRFTVPARTALVYVVN